MIVGLQNQHLKNSDMPSSESLDVRWANDDPNPKSVRRVKRQYEEEYMDAVRSAVNELPPEQKKARLLEMQLYGTHIPPGSAVAPYPGALMHLLHTCSEQHRKLDLNYMSSSLWLISATCWLLPVLISLSASGFACVKTRQAKAWS